MPLHHVHDLPIGALTGRGHRRAGDRGAAAARFAGSGAGAGAQGADAAGGRRPTLRRALRRIPADSSGPCMTGMDQASETGVAQNETIGGANRRFGSMFPLTRATHFGTGFLSHSETGATSQPSPAKEASNIKQATRNSQAS